MARTFDPMTPMTFQIWTWMGAFACLSPWVVTAQEALTLDQTTPVQLTPPEGARLGSWLTTQHPHLSSNLYPLGMVWLDPKTHTEQNHKKNAILDQLSARRESAPDEIQSLEKMLLQLPVKGRLPLSTQDIWLMQAHKNLEPVMGPGAQVVISGRPDKVRVVNSDAQWCDVYFQDSRWTIDYLKACAAETASDIVWLIQPNGQVKRLGVGPWNQHTQESPAPGAWLWVAPRTIPEDLQHDVAQIIATQGPALGAGMAIHLPLTHSSQPVDLPSSMNDWGMSGLLQTPSARTAPPGHAGITINRVWPYTHTTLSISPFESVELGMRYTNISNTLYGPSIAGDQSYKDKSSEIKWRVFNETAMRPAVAIGLRDPGGTGLFAGEYVVASKRWKQLDMSLGMGWGYLGQRGELANPLRVLGSRFAKRQSSQTGSGGTAQLGPLFTGKTALFGGVQWQTPIPELVLKVERDGNHYRNEPFQNDVGGVRSAFNWGMTWQQGPLSLSVGQERGKQWMLGLTISTDMSRMTRRKSSEPAAWPVTKPFNPAPALHTRPSPLTSTPASQNLSEKNKNLVLGAIAEQTGWDARELRESHQTWVIHLDNAQGFSLPERIDRAMAVAHATAPDHINTVRFVLMQQGIAVSSRQLDRALWADSRFAWRGHDPLHASTAAPTQASPVKLPSKQKLTGSTGLGYQQHVGGPDGYLYSLNAIADGQWTVGNGTWLQGSVKVRLNDNYDKYRYTAPSGLPRVRTYIREYLTTERVTLPNVQINQLHQWSENIYSLAYAGALEPMFAGVGAEVMWRPINSQWAIGADINRLAQRDFDQRAGLKDYRVSSGHVTAYWDTRWQGVEAKLAMGQYLAADRGATLEVAKRFNNGARMGAWITKTNVSSKSFGEGSFDKGVFLSIPFDNFLPAWSNQRAHVAWQPLIRDGGARLNKAQTLWNLTQSRDSKEWGARTSAPSP